MGAMHFNLKVVNWKYTKQDPLQFGIRYLLERCKQAHFSQLNVHLNPVSMWQKQINYCTQMCAHHITPHMNIIAIIIQIYANGCIPVNTGQNLIADGDVFDQSTHITHTNCAFSLIIWPVFFRILLIHSLSK